jgi:hypothetical protein
MAKMKRLWAERRSKDEVEKLRFGRLDGKVAVGVDCRVVFEQWQLMNRLSYLFR